MSPSVGDRNSNLLSVECNLFLVLVGGLFFSSFFKASGGTSVRKQQVRGRETSFDFFCDFR